LDLFIQSAELTSKNLAVVRILFTPRHPPIVARGLNPPLARGCSDVARRSPQEQAGRRQVKMQKG
jgi:hypothetical protein